jgi:hypothetical protein
VGADAPSAGGIGTGKAVEAERELLDLVLGDGDPQRLFEAGLVPGLNVRGTGQRVASQNAVRAQRVGRGA